MEDLSPLVVHLSSRYNGYLALIDSETGEETRYTLYRINNTGMSWTEDGDWLINHNLDVVAPVQPPLPDSPGEPTT